MNHISLFSLCGNAIYLAFRKSISPLETNTYSQTCVNNLPYILYVMYIYSANGIHNTYVVCLAHIELSCSLSYPDNSDCVAPISLLIVSRSYSWKA